MTDNIPPQGRPLVTFALFAYNQEKYIREAVEGAFSQTYEPLEIILSDDCSSDRTFEIIQEMATAYVGPHTVRVRRSRVNAGLTEHINDVARLVQGEIVIVAAGDDVSIPVRTEAHIKIYQKYEEAFAVFSNYSAFPDPASKRYHLVESRFFTDAEIIYNGGGIQIGATYSYRRECLTWPASLPPWLTSEDRLLPFRAALLGKVRYMPEALVAYRVSDAPDEVQTRSDRTQVLNNPEHFPQLAFEFRESVRQGKLSLRRRLKIGFFLQARASQIALCHRNFFPNKVIDFIFLPLRLFRKIEVLHEIRKEKIAREFSNE